MTDKNGVKFIFVCPNTNKVFESSDFQIVDNRGIVIDEAGNKNLDAKVALIGGHSIEDREIKYEGIRTPVVPLIKSGMSWTRASL